MLNFIKRNYAYLSYYHMAAADGRSRAMRGKSLEVSTIESRMIGCSSTATSLEDWTTNCPLDGAVEGWMTASGNDFASSSPFA